MARYAVLLRGVNVGGHRRVAMSEFAALLGSLGLTEVGTYLQSGNGVFSSQPKVDRLRLAEQIHDELEHRLGVDCSVLVLTSTQLSKVVTTVPWPLRVSEPTHLHVAYLTTQPAPTALTSFDTERFAPDELIVRDQAAYVWYPDGAGRGRLTLNDIERGLGVRATARNWTTATTLARLTAE